MKKPSFAFENLFIFEMANNHQGDVEHGLRIIHEISKVANEFDIRGGIKLQFRDLDTFIHPDFTSDTSNKHIPRFLSTRLSPNEFLRLVGAIRESGMIPICTPFDEPSVDRIVEMDIDVIKVGSCSAKDWPLLEKVAAAGRPVICSVAGLPIREIDKIVSFFQHRGVSFALMHCVGIYPTPRKDLQLNQIGIFKQRYPEVPIGFSTHEEPNNYAAIGLAYIKGARIFERHVGIETEEHKLNAYTSTPVQVRNWLIAYRESKEMCGSENRPPISHGEEASLMALKRGVYVRNSIQKGALIKKEDVFFAMPLQEGQIATDRWKENLVADRNYEKNQMVSEIVADRKPTKAEIIYSVIHEVKGMLNERGIPIGKEFSIEMSHHYGVERFYEIGAILIEVINRSYCKKLVIQLPNQIHPYHHHKKKEETFQILWGELELELEGNKRILYPGDTQLIQAGIWHKFRTNTGVIFEEISTTSYADDSFYEDKNINVVPREERKTKLENWGRYHFD